MASFTRGRVVTVFLNLLLAPFIFLIELAANLYYWVNEAKFILTDGKAVLISGCDTGFGNGASKLFASRGVKVFAGCLTQTGVDELNNHSANIRAFLFDVTKADSTANAVDYVKQECSKEGWQFWGVVANAGIASPAVPGDWLVYEDYEKVINVNMLGHIRTICAFLPLITESRGRIVVTVSIAGHLAAGCLVPYCASKFGVLGYAEGLRCDLKQKGVRLATVAPEFYPTHIILLEEEGQRVYDRLSEDAKKATSPDKLQEGFQKAREGIKQMASKNDPADVHEIYFHALFGVAPRETYFIGHKAPLYEAFKRLPDFVKTSMLSREFGK